MSYREFVDEAGTNWMVWDTYPDPSLRVELEELRHGWLTFRAGDELRRLVPAPAGWSEEPDEALRHLLEHTTSTKPRTETDSHEGTPRPLGNEEPPLLRHPGGGLGDAADELAAVVERSKAMLERFRIASEARAAHEGKTANPPSGSTE